MSLTAQDLLTIRADRDVYYYGSEALFSRHPDLVHKLCLSGSTQENSTRKWGKSDEISGKSREISHFQTRISCETALNVAQTGLKVGQKAVRGAPSLLEPLLDGLVWRSRATLDGQRRVNYYATRMFKGFSTSSTCFYRFSACFRAHVVDFPRP